MHRADGRGLDRLDLSTLEVLVAGRGGNPQNNGMEASWNNFAPRVGAVYRFNDKTVFRTGYGLTYNAQPWARAVRGDNDYPDHDRVDVRQRAISSGTTTRSSRASPGLSDRT